MSRDPIGWSSGIHRLHLCRGLSLPPNECPVTQSAGAVKYTDYISAEGYIFRQHVPWPNRLQQWNTPTTSLQKGKLPSQRVSRDPIGWSSENTPTTSLQMGIFPSKRVSRDPIGWSSEIHWLHLCRGVSFPPNECSVTQSVRAVEYTDYISAEGYISLPTSVPWPNQLQQWNTPTTSLQRGIFPYQRVSRDPIGCSSGIHRLHLCRGVSLPPNECPVTQSAGAVKYTDYISADGYISLQTSVPWPNRLQQWNTPTTSLQRGIFSSKCVYRDPIGCNSGIHRLHLCRGVSLPPNECPVTQSAGAVEYTDYISAEG